MRVWKLRGEGVGFDQKELFWSSFCTCERKGQVGRYSPLCCPFFFPLVFMQVLFHPRIWLTVKPKTSSQCIDSETVSAHGSGPSLGRGECACLCPACQAVRFGPITGALCISEGQSRKAEEGLFTGPCSCSQSEK